MTENWKNEWKLTKINENEKNQKINKNSIKRNIPDSLMHALGLLRNQEIQKKSEVYSEVKIPKKIFGPFRSQNSKEKI